MKILQCINQNNYYEEILIQIIFTIQATRYTIFIAPLYSIIINCCFIVGFIILAISYPQFSFFRFYYHHHFIVLQPILMQNESNEAICWFNRLTIVLLSMLFLAYTQIMKDIQISPHLRTLKFSIILIAFSLRQFTYWGYIILIIIYDLVVICQTFVMVIPHNQNLFKFQILTCISVVRLITIVTLFSNQWLVLFLFPLILGLSIQFFFKFLHHQITLAIASYPYTLRDIILIYYTYQLGLQPGLFYLSQILVTHSKDCTRPHCFCTEKFELRQEETWKTPESGLEISVNQVMCEILRLYKFSEIANAQEYLLLLTRIETEFRNDRLFETLIRSKRLDTSLSYNIFPSQFRIQSHRKLFYQKLQEKVTGVKINSLIYFNYCNLIKQLGEEIIYLHKQREEIFTMLTLQYQNPLYYLYHFELSEYMMKVAYCENLLQQVVELNSQSIVSQHLIYALYTIVTYQPDKKKLMKNLNQQRVLHLDPLWNYLNDRQCCFVQCKYDKGLIMIGHSVLFPTIIEGIFSFQEESGIQSEFVGQYIDKLIAGPAKDIHSQFLNRLIEEGTPRLLNIGIQQFFITTKLGYMKQIDSLVRLGQSMEHLTFMTIMGFKQEDSCGKVLLSSDGKMYSYCKRAADMLNINQILKRTSAKRLDINLKLSVVKIQYDEVVTGFILMPKICLAQSDRPQQFIPSKSISQMAYYKYFLQHPKQCLVTISSYRFIKSSYDEGKCQFEILYLYQSNLLNDLEHKMMALEIMLKQAMIINNINTDSYITSYTSFKSLITQKNNANNSIISQQKFQIEQQDLDLDDRNFVMSDESIHIQQDPQAIVIFPLSQENQPEIPNHEQKFQNQINISSIISNSFATQDQFLQSKRGQEESTMRDMARENQYALQLNLNNLEIMIHQQKLQGDLEDDVQSPEEFQENKQMQISHNEMEEKYIGEQIEWIKSQVKYQQNQSERQKTHQKQSVQHKIKDQKQTLEKQPSSLGSSDSQQGLITHILHGMMQSNLNQFNNLKIVASLYILSLIIVIILSALQWRNGLEQYFLESRGGQFSLSFLQNLNLMEIAIHLLSQQSDFKALQFYVSKSTQDYIDYCQSVNYMQKTNYDFLRNLETINLPVRRSFFNSSEYITSAQLQARHFLVDQFAEIFVANNETVLYSNSKFSILGVQESYFTLNYPIFFNLSLALIDDVDLKMVKDQENFQRTCLIYILSGISICILTVTGIVIIEISILQWRKNILRTCFLFQNLIKQISDSDSDVMRLLEVDELKHLKEEPRKSQKKNSSILKQELKFQDYLLKKQFWLKQIVVFLCLIGLELIYFIPYYILAASDITYLEKFHYQVNTLGLASLALSNRLVFFVQQYTNPDNNVDESQFLLSDEYFSKYEDEYLYQLSYSQSQSALKLTDLVNGNICNINLSQQMNNYGYQCPYNLQEGYQKFVVSTSNQLLQFRSQYPDYSKDISQLLNDQEFQNILISYGYIFPIFMKNSDEIYLNQQDENNYYYRSSIMLTVITLIAIAIIYGILMIFVIKQFKWIIMTVKLSLYIFSKEQIAGNKHLIQILSKTVTLD